MSAQYRWVNWNFDKGMWSEVVRDAYTKHGNDLAEMIGVTPAAIKHYIRMDYTGGFAYPNMTNFLALCNLLDLDPGEFFTVMDV